jgi:hypothetical protein
VSVQTPNGAEFSIAAKIHLCSGRIFPASGMLFGSTAPTGERISYKTLTETMMIAQLESLVTAGYAQIWEAQRKQLLGTMPVIMVRAVYSAAAGFGGKMLEATGWEDTDFYEMSRRLMGGRSEVPYVEIIGSVDSEFRDAGILHGKGWDPGWLEYLVAQWAREAWDAVQRVEALPWKEIARRNVSTASGSLVDRDDD